MSEGVAASAAGSPSAATPSATLSSHRPDALHPAAGRSAGRLHVIGGRQRAPRSLGASDDWYEYEAALILEVDVAAGDARVVFEYRSPPEAGPSEDPTILFKSGTLRGDRLYLCTQTELLILGLPTFERLGYISLPLFNDVHHVLPTPQGTLLVANTGLDMVLELSASGEILRMWNVLGEDPWARFSPSIDYRRIRTTKPHLAHPNHVFLVGEDVWATRFEQRDAICLTAPGRRIDIGLERIHDGIVHEGLVYFSTVDGHVAVADPALCRVIEVIDLNELHDGSTQLGWCRGLMPDGDGLWVGFSRIRPTKFRENVGWVLRGFKRDLGTHIARYDLRQRVCTAEILVEDVGLSAVFSIFPAAGIRA